MMQDLKKCFHVPFLVLPLWLLMMMGGPVSIAQDSIPFVEKKRAYLGTKDLRKPETVEKQEVFSAIRSKKKLGDIPLNIYIVSREEIIEGNYTTLAEVLQHVPGIAVSRPGSALLGDQFLMGGLIGNTYAKILLNGLFLQNAPIGGFQLGGQLPIRQAERIEIIFGPSSSLYGADAMVGVINIITRSEDDTPYGTFDVLGGLNAGGHVSVFTGGKLGKNDNILNYQIMAQVGGREDINTFQNEINFYDPITYLSPEIQALAGTDSFVQTYFPPNYRGTPTDPLIREIPNLNQMVGLQFQFRNLQASYIRMYRRQHSSTGLNPLYYHYADPESYYGETYTRLAFTYDIKERNWNSQTNLVYSRMRTDPNSSLSTTYREENEGKTYLYAASDEIYLEELITFSPYKQIDLTGGIFLQISGILPLFTNLLSPFEPGNYLPFGKSSSLNFGIPNQVIFNSTRYATFGGFLQSYGNFGKFSFVLSGRFDGSNIYGRSINPKLALQYRLTPTTLIKGSAGTAFRGPVNSFITNSFPLEVVDLRDSLLVNAGTRNTLSPENYSLTDIGLRQDIGDNFSLEFNFSYQEFSNVVQLNFLIGTLPQNRDSALAANNPEATLDLTTLQFLLRGRDLIPKLKLNTEFSFNINSGSEVITSQDLQQLDRTFDLDGVRLVPRWMALWKINMEPFKDFHVNAYFKWLGESIPRYIPPAQLSSQNITNNWGFSNIDLSFSYSFSPYLRGFLSFHNLNNEIQTGLEASEGQIALRANPQLGRQVRIGCSIDL
ncbi:MAG: TonB-dependent receptor [Bacteroidota bacterium]